jgi:gluconate 2-dehydrogenase gamma chain
MLPTREIGEHSVLSNETFWDRRRLLGMAPALTAALGAAGCVPSSKPEKPYSPVFFTSAEWEFVVAAVGRLIPSEGAGPGGIEAGVPEFIDRQMESAYGHGAFFYMKGPFKTDAAPTLGIQLPFVPRDVYRLGIESANKLSQVTHGKPFSSLAANDQDAFLKALEHGTVHLRPVPAPAFFSQLLMNTREGYFADPLYGGNRGMVAWKWIGFPGARADFTDWIDRAGDRYPYGPVSIRGETA